MLQILASVVYSIPLQHESQNLHCALTQLHSFTWSDMAVTNRTKQANFHCTQPKINWLKIFFPENIFMVPGLILDWTKHFCLQTLKIVHVLIKKKQAVTENN